MFEKFLSSDYMNFMLILNYFKEVRCVIVFPEHKPYEFIGQVLPVVGENCIVSYGAITTF